LRKTGPAIEVSRTSREKNRGTVSFYTYGLRGVNGKERESGHNWIMAWARTAQFVSNSAGCVVLVEAEPRGVELFRHDGPLNYIDPRHVLGIAVECGAEALYSSLRDTRTSPKTLTQYARFAVQHSCEWRAASKPREVVGTTRFDFHAGCR
jgi:hypothetical protein